MVCNTQSVVTDLAGLAIRVMDQYLTCYMS